MAHLVQSGQPYSFPKGLVDSSQSEATNRRASCQLPDDVLVLLPRRDRER